MNQASTSPNLFSTLWTVLRKELRDISRDRRTLLLSLLLAPLLYPVVILGMGALAESRVKTQIDKPLDIPTVNAAAAPNLVASRRSKTPGAPPRCTWPSMVTRRSKPNRSRCSLK